MPRVTRTLAALLASTLALAVSACSSSSSQSVKDPAPPVPVGGADTSALVGKWVGDYSSTETGRPVRSSSSSSRAGRRRGAMSSCSPRAIPAAPGDPIP